MRFDLSALGASVLLSTAATASVIVPRNPTPEEAVAAGLALLGRASPEAPNGYTPAKVACPSSRPSIRAATGLSDNETSWLELRRNNTLWAMRDLLGRMNITGLDTDSYIDNNANNATALPNIGIALSGGGYRALMNGAGAVAAFDNRTTNGTASGHLGGLLQSATYLAALSGGGWMVGSLYANNFTSVQSIVNSDSGDLWQFDNSILEGPATGGIQLLDTAEYYDDLYDDVDAKSDAGYETSITDYWGRSLSYQLVNASEGGPAYTFSSIQDDTAFSNGNTPMPILVADGRAPGELLIPGNTTVYEFNPWEMGSFDPTVYGFAPLRYVGSNFTNGSLPSNDSCIAGFDNIGYVMGTSSSLFNEFFLQLNTTDAPEILKSIVGELLEELGQNNYDIADWTPNPFYGYHPDTNPTSETDRLTLVDGGEDLENLPLHPLIQPYRDVDVIFAIDSSADTNYNWPNGTAMVATYERSLNASLENGTAFPSIPDQNTFVNLGLNNRPTFFGCDASNMTGTSPLIVYIPNAPYIYDSNVSTYTLSYNNTARNYIIENGYDVATMGNGTVDSDWPTCVGCAILSRSFDKTGTTVPDVCTTCFDTYCWNGTTNATTPNAYEPDYKLEEVDATSGAERFVPGFVALMVAVTTSVALFL